MRVIRKEFVFFQSPFQREASFIGYVHVCSLLLGHSDKVLKQKSTIQPRNLNLLKNRKCSMIQKKLFTVTPAVLPEEEKSLPLNGLNFRIPPKNVIIIIIVIMLILKTFYRDILNIDVLSAEGLDFIKIKTKDSTAFFLHLPQQEASASINSRI